MSKHRVAVLKVVTAQLSVTVLAIVDDGAVTVVALDTGEVLSSHRIEPDRAYRRNQRLMTGVPPRGLEDPPAVS